MPDLHLIALVAVACLVTATIRYLPFIVFNGRRKTPEAVLYLGRVLPYAVMGMLVVYCLRETTFAAIDGWLPTLIGIAITATLHLVFRNTLLSIIVGTASYILLLNLVF